MALSLGLDKLRGGNQVSPEYYSHQPFLAIGQENSHVKFVMDQTMTIEQSNVVDHNVVVSLSVDFMVGEYPVNPLSISGPSEILFKYSKYALSRAFYRLMMRDDSDGRPESTELWELAKRSPLPRGFAS